jgi:hypothetical protein
VLGLVALADDGEGVEDVRGVVAAEAVEVEEGGVQLAPEQEPPGGAPAERRAVVPTVARERRQVSGGVGQFEDVGEEPVLEQ